jgi:hypothetical protein
MICSSVPTFRDKLSLTFSWVKQFKKNVFFWGCLNLEGEADRLFRNVCNYQLMLRNIPEVEKILFALMRKSEIKHNGNFGKARFVPAVVTQNFGNIDVAYRYTRSWSVRAWLFQSAAISRLWGLHEAGKWSVIPHRTPIKFTAFRISKFSFIIVRNPISKNDLEFLSFKIKTKVIFIA